MSKQVLLLFIFTILKEVSCDDVIKSNTMLGESNVLEGSSSNVVLTGSNTYSTGSDATTITGHNARSLQSDESTLFGTELRINDSDRSVAIGHHLNASSADESILIGSELRTNVPGQIILGKKNKISMSHFIVSSGSESENLFEIQNDGTIINNHISRLQEEIDELRRLLEDAVSSCGTQPECSDIKKSYKAAGCCPIG